VLQDKRAAYRYKTGMAGGPGILKEEKKEKKEKKARKGNKKFPDIVSTVWILFEIRPLTACTQGLREPYF
jgi:hypothetical protein